MKFSPLVLSLTYGFYLASPIVPHVIERQDMALGALLSIKRRTIPKTDIALEDPASINTTSPLEDPTEVGIFTI